MERMELGGDEGVWSTIGVKEGVVDGTPYNGAGYLESGIVESLTGTMNDWANDGSAGVGAGLPAVAGCGLDQTRS